ncbi:MAG: bifunctional 4'-phosphopantothenoylcysteine decarboxylase/phosphopantothenoylcysteine synthetase, partial [Clostridiaceae bacterium]|nr:bifunctional 4'-phosphopantothenoylcysteine decarboxylase/phosphopantothenoylcysteine synthetase [Clostridiaceae bacterium]
MLKGKKIAVGVCGGIAAYKVVDVVSRLKKLGAEIRVIMTKSAQEFVTPLTFMTI